MPSNRRGPDGLTDLERDLCHAIDLGMTDQEAYRTVRPNAKASDLAARSYVCKIRHRPHCSAYLKSLQAKTLARHAHRKDKIVEELALLAFSDLCDFVISGPDGLTVKPLDTLPEGQRRTLSRVSVSKSARGDTIRLATHDKLSALEKLCRLFGLYFQPDDRAGSDTAMSPVERAQRLAAILREGREAKAAEEEKM